jgi:hypothetical protein
MYDAVRCDRTKDFCLEWSVLASGEYWSKIDNTEAWKILAEKGQKMMIESATAPYGCMDLTYKTSIRTMGFTVKKYKSKKLFGNQVPNLFADQRQQQVEKIWNEGRAMEADFFDAEYPSDVAMNKLAFVYTDAYRMLALAVSAESASEFLQRVRVFEGKIQDFGLIMDRATYHFQNYLENNAEAQKDPRNFKYVFAARSDYSILFLNFSPFVWRITEKPKYLIPLTDQDLGERKLELLPGLNHEEAVKLFGAEKLREWAAIESEFRKK